MSTQDDPNRRTPRDSIRWLAVKNMSGEAIPGHALMCLKKDDGDGFYCHEIKGNQILWRVYKPDEDAELFQNPATLIVNGPTVIPPDGEGKGTQDWPAQVLHDGARDALPNFRVCGPKANEWVVFSRLKAFTCLCHDKAKGGLGTGGNPGVHTVWISPFPQYEPPERAYFLTNSQEIDSEEGNLTLTLGENRGRLPPPEYLTLENYSSGGSFLYFDTKGAGTWTFDISATLSSQNATEGSPLRITLVKRPADTSEAEPTPFSGFRNQLIEDDQGYQSPFHSAENVAFGGWIDVEAGDIFEIQANVSMTVETLLFSLVQIGRPPAFHENSALTD